MRLKSWLLGVVCLFLAFTGPAASVAAMAAAGAVAAAGAAPNPRVTTRSLLAEMTDLAGLARFPAPAYATGQSSSRDLASKAPGEPTWFANADAGHFLRSEQRNDGRIEYVLLDAAGPGAVVRIWSANPRGTLRVYLDGQDDRPVIEGPMEQVLGGSHPGLPAPIAGVRGRGYNLYFPIPFATRCRITSDQRDFYFIVNYRKYAPGIQVESFSPEQLRSLASDVEQAAAGLREPRQAGVKPEQARARAIDVTLKAGETKALCELDGAMAITRMVMTPTADDLPSALRSVVLRMTFDGAQTVEAPLGDFFGAAPGLNAFQALPLGVQDGAMYCHWVTPFEKAARVELHNTGKSAVCIKGEIATAPWRWDDRSMHFHAGYRAQYDVPTEPKIDWNYLTASGTGVFAGASFAIDNPVRAWWGEGDEKIYVDGEAFPSWFGTGTEDYYGYAWADPAVFSHAYHNQPRCDGPGNYGRTSVNRFHIMDRIPFTRDLKFDMELWHWKPCQVNLAVTTYWYARPGGTDTYATLKADDLVVRPMPAYQPIKVAGAIEGETMSVIARTGQVDPQEWDGTSGDRHLWWRHRPQTGDTLTLGFAAPRPGRYRVLGRFLKARDYGIHQLAINGKRAGKPIDFFNPDVIVSDEIDLGVFDLEAKNEFSATVVGANGKAEPQHMFGLDYLILKPADAAAPAGDQPATQASAAPTAPGAPAKTKDLVTARQFRRIYDPGAGEDRPWYINDHCFVPADDGTWHLFGITHAEPPAPLDEDHLAHATASSLTQQQWNKQPFAMSVEPQRWGETHLWAPHVIHHDGTYYMFYCGGGADHTRYRLQLATSKDLKRWTRHPNNPLVVDGFDARDPMVLRVGDRWVMYYTANSRPDGANHVVKAVTSRDLIRWGEPRIVFTAPQQGTFGGPTESPFIVRRGEFYYLFCGAWGGYVGTHVFRSRDPFHFSPDEQVGRIESHALEIVRDRNGDWYASHCGWGQGGVFLASLKWNDGLDEAESSMPAPAGRVR